MTDWYTFPEEDTDAQERLIGAWPDAPTSDTERLSMLLDVAKGDVWAWAPESEDDDGNPVDPPATDVPVRLVLAQLQQVRNLWNAGRTDSNGETGMDGFTFTPRPLDKTIRAMIRPKAGVPYV